MILPSPICPPTTETAGYFEISAKIFADWLVKALGRPWIQRPCPPGQLGDLVALVKPRVPVSRYLLMPNHGWTVLLDNRPLGTDTGMLPYHAAKDLGCRSIRATAVEPDHHPYPATILELYDPAATDDPLLCRRTIAAANDGGRWVFSETGRRFPFEDAGAYGSRRMRDRFTPDMLGHYLLALGVPCDSMPDTRSALLVEMPGSGN